MINRANALPRSVVIALLTLTFASIANAQFAYVGCRTSHTVAVVDLTTNNVVASVPEPFQATAMVVTKDGSKAYTSIVTQGVGVIDTATNTSIGFISTPGARTSLTLSVDGTRLYVPDSYGIAGGVVYVIDTATDTVITTIAMPAGSLPRDMAVSPDGSRLYIAETATGNVYVADTTTNTVIDDFPEVTVCPAYYCHQTIGVAVSPDGSKLYAGSWGGWLAVYDTTTKAVLATADSTISVIENIRMSPDGTKAFLFGVIDDPSFAVVDTSTNAVMFTSDSQAGHTWIDCTFSADGATAYLTDVGTNSIIKYDVATITPIGSIPLTGNNVFPTGIAIANTPPVVPFASFNVAKLNINGQGFQEAGSFTLANGASIDPVTQRVTATVGSYKLDIPKQSFVKTGGVWHFQGSVGAAKVSADVRPHGAAFDYVIEANGPDLRAQAHPLRVGLRIGNDAGTATVP